MVSKWRFTSSIDSRTVALLRKMRRDFLATHPHPDALEMAASSEVLTGTSIDGQAYTCVWLDSEEHGMEGYAILKWGPWGKIYMLWIEEFYVMPAYRGMPALMGFIRWLKSYLRQYRIKRCLFLAWDERRMRIFGRLMKAKPLATLMEV